MSEFSPLVSVLIRSMDRVSLFEALASIDAQTYQSIEIVLVNAKGAEHKDISHWVGRIPIRFVGATGRLNRSAAANIGLEQARGEYLIFLDDDDLIDAGHIESLVRAVAQSPHCKAAFSATRIIDAAGVTLGIYNHPFSAAQLLVGNLLPIHAVLFSRELVTAGCRFDSMLETYEDWDFWLQVSRLTGFVQTGNVSAVYRSFLGDSGMSRAEDRPLQRQRRSVVWRKWWSVWSVENLELLVFDLEDRQEQKDKENTELRHALDLQGDINTRLIQDLSALHISFNEQISQLSNINQGLNQALAELRGALTDRESAINAQSAHIRSLQASIQELMSSTSWKVSAPIRHIGKWTATLRRKIRAARLLAVSAWHFLRRDSFGKQIASAYRFIRLAGWTGVKIMLARKSSHTSGLLNVLTPNAHLQTKGLAPSSLEMQVRHDYLPLSSIDVDKYEYFFFDVFDTAIIRLFEKPVDLFKYIEHATESTDFQRGRIQKERETREANHQRKDVKLAEIYQTFGMGSAAREIEAELLFCIKHPETFAFYKTLVSKGKKIYFVSDMYLDKVTISEILHKNGFDKYEDVFVSSEDDFIKGDGSRFAWLKNGISDSVGKAIHIGDNHVSDWVQPRKNGYDAFHYVESIEFYRYDSFLFSKATCLIDHNSLGISFLLGIFRYWKSGFLTEKPGYWKQFGFFYGGALVSAFCGFVNKTISQARLSTSRIFFLARDGDIMSKVYKLLYSEHDAVYLLASRRCMSFPSLKTLDSADDEDMLKLFTTPIGVAGVGDLMERFGYDDLHELRDAFSRLESKGHLCSEPEIERCIVEHKDAVLSKAAAERGALLEYLDAMNFFADPDIVIADVGWGGSIQNALVKLITQAAKGDHRLHGIYMGVSDNVAHADFKSGFLFKGDKSRFAGFLNLIELITSSPKDGVVRVEKAGDGYLPISPKKNADELHRQSIAAEIQAGILEFAHILKDRKIDPSSFVLPGDFEVLFGALQEHASAEDVKQLGRVKHAMTLGSHYGDQVLNKKG